MPLINKNDLPQLSTYTKVHTGSMIGNHEPIVICEFGLTFLLHFYAEGCIWAETQTSVDPDADALSRYLETEKMSATYSIGFLR